SDWKRCATCEFWSGPRIPGAFLNDVRFDQKNKAQCVGKRKGQSKSGNDSCPHWVKWAVLK
ncbi:MAG: hypothetical protein ACYC5H_18955, partial [Methylovirgula sp.]